MQDPSRLELVGIWKPRSRALRATPSRPFSHIANRFKDRGRDEFEDDLVTATPRKERCRLVSVEVIRMGREMTVLRWRQERA